MPYCCEENGRGGQKLFCYTMLFNFWVVSRSETPWNDQKNFVLPVSWEYIERKLASNGQ